MHAGIDTLEQRTRQFTIDVIRYCAGCPESRV